MATNWQDNKEILVPSIATIPSFATDVHVKIMDISIETSIEKELCDIKDFKKMVKDFVQMSETRYRPLCEGMKHETGRKRSMAEDCEREDRAWKRRRTERTVGRKGPASTHTRRV